MKTRRPTLGYLSAAEHSHAKHSPVLEARLTRALPLHLEVAGFELQGCGAVELSLHGLRKP